ncbi:hypothetical protein V2G26_013463 [Clonostachys chloroleuca]
MRNQLSPRTSIAQLPKHDNAQQIARLSACCLNMTVLTRSAARSSTSATETPRHVSHAQGLPVLCRLCLFVWRCQRVRLTSCEVGG